jgi:hypothetical protein
MVMPPAWAVVPKIRVPAVMAARSLPETENVDPVEPTEMAFAPFGSNVTVLVPELTLPEKETSLAVIVIAELVVDIEVEPAFVTLPVPLVVNVTPVVPVAFALRFIAPLEPEDVLSISALPDRAWEVVMVPLPVSVRVPLVEATAPDVPTLADAPVVVTEKSPPTVEVPIVTAPVLEISAVPEPPVLAVTIVAAVSIGVPLEPIVPLPDAKLTVPEVRVTPPEWVIVPEPLAVTLIVPEVPVDTFALIATLVLPVSVAREMMPLPDMESALEIVRPLPDVTEILPEVSTIGPRVTVPEALIVRFLVPSVIV